MPHKNRREHTQSCCRKVTRCTKSLAEKAAFFKEMNCNGAYRLQILVEATLVVIPSATRRPAVPYPVQRIPESENVKSLDWRQRRKVIMFTDFGKVLVGSGYQ